MSKVLRIIGHVWTSPVTLLALLYVSFFSLMKWYVFSGVHGDALVWVLNPDRSKVPSILQRRWAAWGGQTFGSVVVMSVDPMTAHGAKTLVHESEHVKQYMKLGTFFLPAYAFMSLIILLACPQLDPYRDNPLEVDAYRTGSKFDNYL